MSILTPAAKSPTIACTKTARGGSVFCAVMADYLGWVSDAASEVPLKALGMNDANSRVLSLPNSNTSPISEVTYEFYPRSCRRPAVPRGHFKRSSHA